MTTMIRPTLSEKNRYYIDKHRHYELKHFCLQYPAWKKAFNEYGDPSISSSMIERFPASGAPSDPTARRAVMRAHYAKKIELIEKAAREADNYLHNYILKGVTENLSYTHLRSRYDIPCGRDMYYEKYRRFFWLLSEARN